MTTLFKFWENIRLVFTFHCHSKTILVVFELRNFVRDLLNLGRTFNTRKQNRPIALPIIDGSCLKLIIINLNRLEVKTYLDVAKSLKFAMYKKFFQNSFCLSKKLETIFLTIMRTLSHAIGLNLEKVYKS